MSAAPRPMPEKCEVCRFWPATRGMGFPAWPGRVLGLPEHLRGACIWVCDSLSCARQAQTRALRTARDGGCKAMPELVLVTPITESQERTQS